MKKRLDSIEKMMSQDSSIEKEKPVLAAADVSSQVEGLTEKDEPDGEATPPQTQDFPATAVAEEIKATERITPKKGIAELQGSRNFRISCTLAIGSSVKTPSERGEKVSSTNNGSHSSKPTTLMLPLGIFPSEGPRDWQGGGSASEGVNFRD